MGFALRVAPYAASSFCAVIVLGHCLGYGSWVVGRQPVLIRYFCTDFCVVVVAR